jgi:hypothetical protein
MPVMDELVGTNLFFKLPKFHLVYENAQCLALVDLQALHENQLFGKISKCSFAQNKLSTWIILYLTMVKTLGMINWPAS